MDLPHDFCIHGPYDRHAPLGTRYGFRPLGIGWYRKTFPTLPIWSGRRVFLDFEGVCRESQVWINGVRVVDHTTWSSAWRGYACDITAHLRSSGENNVVAVRADAAKEPGVTWYNGGGIYRHVHLIVVDPVHVIRNGTFVNTSNITSQQALVSISNEMSNFSVDVRQVAVINEVFDPNGLMVASSNSTMPIPAGETRKAAQQVQVRDPLLWDVDHPHLYRLVTKIRSVEGRDLDRIETTFGIRDIRLSPDGLFLNGKRTFITGINIHHDLGCLGVAAFDRAIERRLKLVKEIGLNGLRLSHNLILPRFR